LSERQARRKRQQDRELRHAASGCIPLTSVFVHQSQHTITSLPSQSDDSRLASPNPPNLNNIPATSENHPVAQEPVQWVSAEEQRRQAHQVAIQALKKKINSTKSRLHGQNLTRHQAVLAFLSIQQSRRRGETRRQLAFFVARCFNRGWYFARKIVSWEISWVQERTIEEGRRGCFAKVRSWLNDEGVQLAVCEWISGAGEGKSSYPLGQIRFCCPRSPTGPDRFFRFWPFGIVSYGLTRFTL